ncbi:MAG: hypothetical protein ACLP6E_11570 [Acidimicrobiales bacterium]
MRIMLRKHRRGAVSAGAVMGTTLIALAMAVPAGASTVAAGNTVLNGGGSNTTYTMMQQLSDLYNSAPGCNLITSSSSTQELDYDCASSYATAENGEENGYSLTYPSLNPYNDVIYQEPALGSGNGIKELELQGADTPGSAPDNDIAKLDFARSSRAAINTPGGGSSDDKSGLNFVAYAADAVPWFHFTNIPGEACPKASGSGTGTATISSAISNLTDAQLTDIYNGTDTEWSQVDPSILATGSKGAIYVFMAQSGSGTEATWAGDLGLTSGTYPYAGVTAGADSTIPSGDYKAGTPAFPAPFEIFENEVSDIFTANGDIKTADQATYPVLCNSIFFFSYGKYTLLCPGNVCAGVPTANAGATSALGKIDGIKAQKCTILDTCTGSKTGETFFTDRQLYNVYSDGSNANLPFPLAGSPAIPPFESQAVQNLVSTYGFLCNPATHNDVDPLSPTDATYGTEIDNVITANGFFQLPLGVMGDSGIATPPDPGATGYDANYAAAEPTPSGDMGYCRVTTTDGDGNN